MKKSFFSVVAAGMVLVALFGLGFCVAGCSSETGTTTQPVLEDPGPPPGNSDRLPGVDSSVDAGYLDTV
jgi:hypothetical protein